MKAYRIPNPCRAVLFDMDSTLYTNEEYAFAQIELQLGRLAAARGKSLDQTKLEVAAHRQKWSDENGGLSLSLANAFVAFGVDIAESSKWRDELAKPGLYLGKDARLRSALEKLALGRALAVVTNNPVGVAEKTLGALGVRDLFCAVVGLDTCGVSKPHAAPYLRAASLCGAEPETCLSVGDRYDIDVALPLELGMGGVLVDGVEDVYALPELLP